MRRALIAAVSYAAIVFAAGFVLGTLRVLVLAPALGALGAVALELPVMLAVAWLAARRAVLRHRVPGRPGPRLAMGVAAFVMLMAAELALARWGFGQTLREVVRAWARPEGALGLAGQVGFALMPLARLAAPRADL